MSRVAWQPQMGPQTLFVQCPAFECLYGGALGGGKTDALLGDYSSGIDFGPDWIGVFFRRHFADMDAVIRRAKEIFNPVYGHKCFKASPNPEFRFPTGAVLQFRALDRTDDLDKYQGQPYQWVGFDELTQWPDPYQYTYMITRLRTTNPDVRCRIRAATNPGGAGHTWVKNRFVDPVPPGVANKITTKKGKVFYRVFIPAKLVDNVILSQGDEEYSDRVTENIDPTLAKALVDGRWDIVAGAAFPEYDPDIHVIDPAPIPTDKKVWRAMDWGFMDPYCNLWMFEYDSDVIVGNELYGWSGTPNIGTQEPPRSVRKKIESYELLNNLYVPVGLIDGQTTAQHGQDGIIYDLLGGRDLGWKAWPKGPNSRVQQKQNVHQFLSVTNGRSRLKIMRHCTHLLRTLPTIPVSRTNNEDVNTDSEDHGYDALRGGLTMKVRTRDEMRKIALRRRRDNEFITAADLPYGGF